MITAGTQVRFAFELHRVTLADPIRKREGTGSIIGPSFVLMDPAYEVRVEESESYQPGTVITVRATNLRRL